MAPVVRRVSTVEHFESVHHGFVSGAVKGILEKRRVAGYILRDKEGPAAFNPLGLISSVSQLHTATGIALPNGRRFSFGCVQVVNVRSCQDIAMALCNRLETARSRHDMDIRVVCLHGRLSLATRTVIDEHLNFMLSRKGPNGDLAPLGNACVRDFLAASPAKNVVIILVSTMETTGRDHDFDWGIIESRQERDIIQFAGRIRRHREALAGDGLNNLRIFNAPLKWGGSPLNKTDEHPFSLYGVADKIGDGNKSEIKDLHLYRKSFDNPLDSNYGFLPSYAEMMSMSYGEKLCFITPKRALVDIDMREGEFTGNVAHTVRACETGRLRNALFASGSDSNKTGSLADWLGDRNRAGRLLNRHQNTYRFRSSHAMECYWRDPEDNWYFVSIPGREYDPSASQKQGKFLEVDFVSTGLLFQINEEAEILYIQRKTGSFGFKDRVRLSSVYLFEIIKGDMSRFKYHCQIGVVIDE